jgi:hypothetical protein
MMPMGGHMTDEVEKTTDRPRSGRKALVLSGNNPEMDQGREAPPCNAPRRWFVSDSESGLEQVPLQAMHLRP